MPAPTSLNVGQRIVLRLISYYQAVWSPDHSPRKAQYPYGYCRYYPTCSEYGHGAVEKYGVIKGGVLTIWRILRCNPWARGGHDPVP